MNKRIRGLAWGLSLLCTTASAADNITVSYTHLTLPTNSLV